MFRGRRGEDLGLGKEDYALAWNVNFGIARVKYVDLAKDVYEDVFE